MIDIIHKFPELDKRLITLLEGLTLEEWHKPTVAKLWTVKDVVAHLLDGNIRVLSGLRDNYQGEKPDIQSYQDLLDYLNRLNAEWVKAMKRVSPAMLIDLLKHTGQPFYQYYASLDPYGKAKYAVAWAGEQESKNWMHIAREYTEKFLHQQQIRDAVGKQGILTAEFFLPFLDICMYALPHTLRNTKMEAGTILKMTISGDAGGSWLVTSRGSHWKRIDYNSFFSPSTEVIITANAAWKLFSKSLRAEDLRDDIQVIGNKELGEEALKMVSFMA